MGLFDKLRRRDAEESPLTPPPAGLELRVGPEALAGLPKQLAALMRGEVPPGVQLGGTSIEIVGDVSNLSDEQRAKLRALGIDLDQVAAGDASGIAPLFDAAFMTPTTADADADADDTLSRLERLQRLREQGALTEAEFAEQKRRILGDG